MRPAVEAEKLGIASVVIATSGFTMLAKLLAKSTGIDQLPVAEYPGPMGIDDPDRVRSKIVSHVIDGVVAGLTRGVKASGSTPARIGKPGDI
ncbi:MAG: hypothetical protein ACKVQU_03035, partial [Burkholderiales bacterium]